MNYKIFNREGSKFRYKDKIIPLFPVHDTYIEPFLGTGAIFFNKPLAKYNLLNDHSKFIYNLWYIFKNNETEKLVENIKKTLIYSDILKKEDSIEAKLLFLCTSLYGDEKTIRLTPITPKKHLLDRINTFKVHYYNYLENAILESKNYLKFLKSIGNESFSDLTFIYADPPYLISKGSLKDNKGWLETDLRLLIEFLLSKKCNFAISEFNDDFVIDIFKEYGLFITEISKSTGIASVFQHEKIEILATNYDTKQPKQIELL